MVKLIFDGGGEDSEGNIQGLFWWSATRSVDCGGTILWPFVFMGSDEKHGAARLAQALAVGGRAQRGTRRLLLGEVACKPSSEMVGDV